MSDFILKKSYRIFLIFIFVTQIGCAPTAKENSSIISLKNKLSFPYVFLDFKSASLAIVEIDGVKVLKYGWIELPAGKHKIIVEVNKGPTGYLGTAPLLGKCLAELDFVSESGKSYEVAFIRESDKEYLILKDKSTKDIILKSKCEPKKIY